MTAKTRPHLPIVLAALLLVGILAVTMASTSTAASDVPEPPTGTCDETTVGNPAYTYTGETCIIPGIPSELAQYDEFVCTQTSTGNYRWVHVRRSCIPFFTPQF